MTRTWTEAGRAYLKTPGARRNLEASAAAPAWSPVARLVGNIDPVRGDTLARVIHELRLPRVTDIAYASIPSSLSGAFAIRCWFPNGRAEVHGLDFTGSDILPCFVDFYPLGDPSLSPDVPSDDLRAMPSLGRRDRDGHAEDLRLDTGDARYYLALGGVEDGATHRVIVDLRTGDRWETVALREPLTPLAIL